MLVFFFVGFNSSLSIAFQMHPTWYNEMENEAKKSENISIKNDE